MLGYGLNEGTVTLGAMRLLPLRSPSPLATRRQKRKAGGGEARRGEASGHVSPKSKGPLPFRSVPFRSLSLSLTLARTSSLVDALLEGQGVVFFSRMHALKRVDCCWHFPSFSRSYTTRHNVGPQIRVPGPSLYFMFLPPAPTPSIVYVWCN